MRQKYGKNVLKKFGVTENSFLGSGGESRVYALDEKKILRIYGLNTPRTKISLLEKFYKNLDTTTLSFEIPIIHEVGKSGKHFYSIESIISGDSLANQFPSLNAQRRRKHLDSYILAVGEISNIAHEFSFYGEILEINPVQSQSWSDFLIIRTEKTLSQSLDSLRKDIPNIEKIIYLWQQRVHQALSTKIDKSLVHGDYFPGNVMTNGNGTVTGVIDFSPLTVVGDWRMDIAGALIFLEVTPGYRETDSEYVGKAITKIYKIPSNIIELYRIYYSLWFSFAERDDLALYSWCIKNLSNVGVVGK